MAALLILTNLYLALRLLLFRLFGLGFLVGPAQRQPSKFPHLSFNFLGNGRIGLEKIADRFTPLAQSFPFIGVPGAGFLHHALLDAHRAHLDEVVDAVDLAGELAELGASVYQGDILDGPDGAEPTDELMLATGKDSRSLQAMLRELVRVVRPGGTILFVNHFRAAGGDAGRGRGGHGDEHLARPRRVEFELLDRPVAPELPQDGGIGLHRLAPVHRLGCWRVVVLW